MANRRCSMLAASALPCSGATIVVAESMPSAVLTDEAKPCAAACAARASATFAVTAAHPAANDPGVHREMSNARLSAARWYVWNTPRLFAAAVGREVPGTYPTFAPFPVSAFARS